MDSKFIASVKSAMGLTDAAPAEVEAHIRAAAFMMGAGVCEAALLPDDPLAVNCTAIGANDIFTTESGEVRFSETFLMMIAQLRA